MKTVNAFPTSAAHRGYRAPDVIRTDIATENGFARSRSGSDADDVYEDNYGWF